jgi:very-short-patch-repair endonuclease
VGVASVVKLLPMKYRPAIGSTERARELRANMTAAERMLWRLLRESFPEARFRRQVPIRSFIADFASHRARLIIEVDGGQHSLDKDARRTKLLEAEGYRVLRFWNNDVLQDPRGVWTRIDRALLERHPHPASPIKGEG